jgi:SpoVK/Ycf46/Vps4 family AAA+-type ATPase
MESEFDGDYILESTDSYGIIITEGFNFIRYNLSSNSVTVTVYGDKEFIEDIRESVFGHFEEVTSHIEWVYASDGSSVNVPLNKDRLPVAEMYPFLKDETLESYYDRYLNSQANILLLIGPPGTGKTTFIRGLLSHSNSSAIVTYDASILEKDFLFARFIEDDANIMVLEDSDNFLKARSDGNTMMHRFLNVGDGLVTTKGKKLIFSTNLPSIRDIDSALVRPGRCFDILNFDTLTQSEAENLSTRLGVQLDGIREKWSIAEVFNKQVENSTIKKVGRKVGFI